MSTTNAIRIIILDTETNGLPKNYYASITTPSNWPAILQLSWSKFDIQPDMTLVPVDSREFGLALHPSIPWNTDAAAIHGLTEVEARHGTLPATALLALAEAFQDVDCIIAHNLAFDRSIIRAAAWAEFERGATVHLKNIWPTGKQEICTMQQMKNIMRIPSPYYGNASGKFKVPTLSELFVWLIGYAFDVSGASLHSATNDTRCLAECIKVLLQKGMLVRDKKRLLFTLLADA